MLTDKCENINLRNLCESKKMRFRCFVKDCVTACEIHVAREGGVRGMTTLNG